LLIGAEGGIAFGVEGVRAVLAEDERHMKVAGVRGTRMSQPPGV
jgi:hypothetical protein